MRRDQVTDIPAGLPFLALTSGLAAAHSIAGPRLTVAALSAIALLVLALRRPYRYRLSLVVAMAAAGLAFADNRLRIAHDIDQLIAGGRERFVRIEAPIRTGWENRGEPPYSLRVDRFRVFLDAVEHDVPFPLTIYSPSPPPPVGRAARIGAEGFLRRSERGTLYLSVKSARLLAHSGDANRWSAAVWSRTLQQRLDEMAAEDTTLARPVALAKALLLGRSEQLPDDLRESYRRGGTYHLLVFSGMQISLVAVAITLALRMFQWPRLADWSLLTVAIIAPWFAGGEPSATRAGWMIGLYALSRILHRPTPTENLFFVAAILRLAMHPEELTNAGFALTYAATGGLIFVGKPLVRLMRERGIPLAAIGYGVGAELATAPLTLFYFNQLVIAGSVVTLIISPLLSSIFGLSIVACVLLPLSTVATETALRSITPLDAAAGLVNHLAAEVLGVVRLAASPPLITVVLSFLALLLIILFVQRQSIRPLAALVLLVPVTISFIGMRGVASAPSIELLDVGQGEAILLRDGIDAVLVDGGGRRGDVSFGRRVLLPLLLERGVRELDAVMLSHPHPDHCEGLQAVIEHLHVRRLLLSGRHFREDCSQTLFQAARERRVDVQLFERTPFVVSGRMHFDPILPRLRYKRSTLNNGSVVLRVELGGRRVLLTGDIEKDAERDLAEDEAGRISADVLKIAHHGSKSSSTAPFLDAVGPRMALISSGPRNLFGHPSPEVIDRLEQRLRVIGRTDTGGSIRVEFRGQALHLTRQIDTPQRPH
ncbi:MAG TPA: DNA internalization-related competence protein ComEC/Rec2 [Thermoanaerobaculia bacterium]|nr:DNA internalization-related competence protein ComEC/Rec2 [Thermoanaerobaculia bacterium]